MKNTIKTLCETPRTRQEMAAQMPQVHPNSVARAVKEMHKAGELHIAGWQGGVGNGRTPALYQAGPGEDVAPPPPLTSQQRVAAHRARLKAQHAQTA